MLLLVAMATLALAWSASASAESGGLAPSCPAGWTPLNDTCYAATSELMYGWQPEQMGACGRLHAAAVPVSIHSEQTDRLLASLTVNDTWIGLFRETVHRPFVWWDGAALDFTNWVVPPDEQWPNHVCVALSTDFTGGSGDSGRPQMYGYWYDDDCTDDLKPVFCQLAATHN